MTIESVIDDRGDAQPVKHLPGIIGIAIGMHELAARQPAQRSNQAVVARQAVERDIMDIAHEMVGIDVVMLHQSGERGSGTVKMHLLHPAGLGRIDLQQPFDIGGHPLVDQFEQPVSSRIQAIVEVEDPIADVGEARVHGSLPAH